jgi:hypothetical protein
MLYTQAAGCVMAYTKAPMASLSRIKISGALMLYKKLDAFQKEGLLGGAHAVDVVHVVRHLPQV